MIVVIANKFKEHIASSELKGLSYKCATGYYSAKTFVSNLKKSGLAVDTLVIDITAVRDMYNTSTWKDFSELIEPSKTFILLDMNKSYTNVGFFSMLIDAGIYNFAKTPNEIAALIKKPKSYEDVEEYKKLASVEEAKRAKSKTQYNEYDKKKLEKQEEMTEYVHKSQEEGFYEPKKPIVFGSQVFAGLVALPLLTFISTYIFFAIEFLVAGGVSPESAVGTYLYSNLYGTELTPLMVIGFLIAYMMFMIYYVVLDNKIVHKQVAKGKFIIVTLAIYFTIMFVDYYILHIFEGLFSLTINTTGFEIYQDFYSYNIMVAGFAIALYYYKLLIETTKVVKFEKDLAQRLSFLEMGFVSIMAIVLILPVAYWFLNIFANNNVVYETLGNIAHGSFMAILVGIEVVLALVLLWKAAMDSNIGTYKAKEEKK